MDDLLCEHTSEYFFKLFAQSVNSMTNWFAPLTVSFSRTLHSLGLPFDIKIQIKLFPFDKIFFSDFCLTMIHATPYFARHNGLYNSSYKSRHFVGHSLFGLTVLGLERRRWSFIDVDCSAMHDNVADSYVGDYHITSGKINQLNGVRIRFISFWQTNEKKNR